MLDINVDPKIPLIIGRPFMKTARMLVKMDKGEVKVIVKDHEVIYKLIGVT